MNDFKEYRDPETAGGKRGLYYQLSGRWEPGRLLLYLLPAAAIAAALSFAYAWLLLRKWTNGLEIGVSLAFGVLLMINGSLTNLFARNRSRRAGIVSGCVMGLFTFYVSWGMWSILQGGGFHPAGIVDTAMLRWSSGKLDPFLLAMGWLLETAVLLGANIVAFSSQTEFCEECREWSCTLFRSGRLSSDIDPEELRRQLEAHNFSTLLKLPAAGNQARHTQVEIAACVCGKMLLLNVTRKKEKRGRRGSGSSEKIISNLYLSPAEKDLIIRVLSAPRTK